MEDVKEAKALVQGIRRAMHVDEATGSDLNVRNLTNALKMLSEELYSKPTHFILELIQNADDNKYASGVEPKLTMLYREDGYLWIGCNEVGFTSANIRAICAIADSTKKIEGARKGYIGEKGIGFKAVFKVADCVWIKSGAASFMYDKDKPLGMIAPQWAEFPEHPRVNEQTMICLRVPNRSHRKNVHTGLLGLKPELLLFLRQLRSIDIQILSSSDQLISGSSLSREDGHLTGIKHVTLKQVLQAPYSVHSESLLVFEHTAYNMPREERRPGVTESNIVMAFPIDVKGRAVVENRKTFNFLPIRCYGLPFLLQADFMLLANREDILQDNAWNQELISATVDLFLVSIDKFDSTGQLKYAWPKFAISQGAAHGTIFHYFFRNLLERLKKRTVIESRQGTRELPESLQTVPAIFMDGSNPPKPLVIRPGGSRAYAHMKYNKDDLIPLGVKELSARDFCGALIHYVKHNASEFRARPAERHERLAAAVNFADPTYVRNANLIPLQDGRWICANNGDFYFAEITDNLFVPTGIHIAMVDIAAARNEDRRARYKQLGAKTLDAPRVFQLILDQHRKEGPESRRWTLEEAVSHAWFLFSAPMGRVHQDVSTLLVAPASSKPLRQGSRLYMDLQGSKFSFSKVYGTECWDVEFINPRYLEYAPRDQTITWLHWLQEELKVNTLPNLRGSKKGSITPEFRWLIEHRPSTVWLSLVLNNFKHYTEGLDPDTIKCLSNSPVDCADGQRRPMSEVYLPTTLKMEALATGVIPTLSVEDTEKPDSWTRLAGIGLNTVANLKFYLTVLASLPGIAGSTVSADDVKRIYTAIVRWTKGADAMTQARKAFQDSSLICVPSGIEKNWVGLAQARWSAPQCLSGFTSLKELYPDHRELFVNCLQIRPASASDFAERLLALSSRVEQVDTIKSLLVALSGSLETDALGQDLPARLKASSARILPVRHLDGKTELRALKDKTWFYADTSRLGKIFDGKVPLLDFDMVVKMPIARLLKDFGLESHRLGPHVHEDTEAVGEKAFQGQATDYLTAKARYISRLVDPISRPTVCGQLSAIEVWSAASLVVHMYVVIDFEAIYGRDDAGRVLTSEMDGRFVVYIPGTFTATGGLPTPVLCDWLMEAFKIPKARESTLIKILVMTDDEEIQEELEKKGLMADAPVPAPSELEEMPSDTDPLDVPLVFGNTVAEDNMPVEKSAQGASGYGDGASISLQSSQAVEAPMKRKEPRTVERTVQNGSKMTATSLSDKAATAFKLSDLAAPSMSARLISPNGTTTPHDASLMNGMRSAPNASMPETASAAYGGKRSRFMQQSGDSGPRPSSSEGDEYQLENSAEGENFVFKMLTDKFQAPEDCWTSRLRADYGLAEFEDSDGDFADFTITDPGVCDRLSKWLGIGSKNAARGKGDALTYHLEVKATTGFLHEPFSMSTNQMAQAKAWHESDSDVYVILRVSELRTNPDVHHYVDPIQLEKEGKLKFAPSGFYVRPS